MIQSDCVWLAPASVLVVFVGSAGRAVAASLGSSAWAGNFAKEGGLKTIKEGESLESSGAIVSCDNSDGSSDARKRSKFLTLPQIRADSARFELPVALEAAGSERIDLTDPWLNG